MLTVASARRLRDAGLTWSPASGDRFVVADRGMDEEVFVISQMVIEHHRAPTGGLLRFNGTTEWALDSLRMEQALWLPREDQLRTALGEQFVSLTRTPHGWVVSTSDGGVFEHEDPEEAYAAALLARLPHPAAGRSSSRSSRRPDGMQESVGDAVLLTGCFGSGKSTVAVEIADQLDHQGTRYALLDLDFLGWFGLGGHDDANLSPLLLANLTSVAANYRRAGIERFVLAHTTDGADEVQQIQVALGAPLRVVRLIVPLDVVERRLGPDPTSGREHDLHRARTWLEQGLGLDVEDLAVGNDRPVSEVAAEIVAWLGWR